MSPFNLEQIQEWEERVLRPVLNGETPEEGQLDRLGGLALLSADVDKVKEYVFETAKLPEVRGASMILDELNRGWPDICGATIRQLFADEGFDVQEENEDSSIIFAGGGSLLAVAPYDVAQALQQKIEALYPRETGMATVSCVVRHVRLSELRSAPQNSTGKSAQSTSPFSRLMYIQAVELRRRKEEKNMAPLFEEVSYCRRCDSCGRRPASVFQTKPEPRYLCKVCAIKAGDKNSNRTQDVDRRKRKSRWNKAFAQHTGVDVDVPRDLNEIGASSNGYVGFIYADGDGVGSRLEKSASLAEYRKRSKNLTKVMQDIVFGSLKKHLKTADGGVRPFEIITIGGDDALLITPADVALAVAHSICDEFPKRLQSRLWDNAPPTMSAGVVIAHQDNPINFMFDTAQELLKSAKRKSHDTHRGAIDFLTFKSQTMLATSLAHLRSSPPWAMQSPETKERIVLTARPYTIDDLSNLFDSVRILKQAGFGRSWLKNLSLNLRRGRLAASIFYLYQYARLPESQQQTLARLHGIWEMGPKHGRPHDIPPWRFTRNHQGYDEFETPWLDIIEVMDFLPE